MLSQMCGRLYFPIFLLSVGLFTLMYIDSLIVLAKLLSFLPIILKFSIDVSWPLILWCWNIGEGAFKCSLYLSQKIFLIHQCTLPTVNASTGVAVDYTILVGNFVSNKDDHTDQGQSTENVKKWVINLSSIPLTEEQENILSHRPNFAISPKKPLLGDYILNIEKACQSLDTNIAEELSS